MQGTFFSAGHASEASGGGADSFSDFGNRFELGTIKTPIQNSTPLRGFLFYKNFIDNSRSG